MTPIIVCIKVGQKYGAEYVNRLAAAVARHTTKPHEFLCLTAADPITAIATLLTKALGFAVGDTTFGELTREHQLKLIMRGINEAIAKDDWGTCDALFGKHRELLHETGP